MDLAKFVKDNLIGGFQNGTWDEFQVRMFSMNYLMRGQIKQDDFDEIMQVLEPHEAIEEDSH